MADERSSTPEKQLLDLIENPREQNLKQKKIKRRSFGLFSFSALQGRISFLLESLRSGAFFQKSFLDVKNLNQFLKGGIILLVFYFVGNFVMSLNRLGKMPEFVTKNIRPPKEVQAEEAADRRVAYYLEGSRARDIFKFGDFAVEEDGQPEEEIPEPQAPAEEMLSKGEILARQLGLVGIGWSEDPDVMVENVESKKIYFLKRGQKIDGLIKVEAIFQDKVILTYDNGKELELQ